MARYMATRAEHSLPDEDVVGAAIMPEPLAPVYAVTAYGDTYNQKTGQPTKWVKSNLVPHRGWDQVKAACWTWVERDPKTDWFDGAHTRSGHGYGKQPF